MPKTVDSVTVTATPENSSASITIAGTATKSLSVTLGTPGSSKDITIVLKSPSGSQSTYAVTVNKAVLAGNTALSALAVTPGTLTPGFDPNTLTYTVNVAHDVSSVTVSATKADLNAVMLIGSVTVPAGTASGEETFPLSGPGTPTVVSINVTAQSGGVPKTYTVTVNRVP